MLKLLKLCVIMVLSINCYSQTVEGNFNFAPDNIKIKDLDLTDYNVVYAYQYLKDSRNKTIISTAQTVLQVGKNYIKFTDVYNLKEDSLKILYMKLPRIGAQELNKILKIKSKQGFESSTYYNLTESTYIYQKRIASDIYEFSKNSHKFIWKINSEYKEISGYKVQKAATSFAGRQWIVWFANDIPLNYGPYLFNGLPGLILEAYDIDENFKFSFISMDKSVNKIYILDQKEIIKIFVKDVRELEKKFHDRPDLFINGLEALDKSLKAPYNPLELTD